MNVFALISAYTKGDDENNYIIRMTDDGMMTAAFSYILVVWDKGGIHDFINIIYGVFACQFGMAQTSRY